MKIRFLIPFLCAAVSTVLAQNTQAQVAAPQAGSTRQMLRGHIPSAVAGLPSLGPVPASTRLNLAIGLPLRNQSELSALLQQLYDPASPNYRHFLTPEQFTARFGPSRQDYQAVVAFAQANGLEVTTTHPNRMLVDVNASVADIERAFHLKLQLHQHPTEARDFYAPDVEPSLDLTVPVLRISGLESYFLPRPANLHAKPLDLNASPQPKAGSGPGGTLLGNDFRKAYLPGVTGTGFGQSIGLLEFDGYYPGDIVKYLNKAGLATVPLQNVYIDGFNGIPGSANTEVALDIEVAIAMAPGVSKIIVYQAPNPSPWVDLLNRMASDNEVKQLSCSWGGGGVDLVADQIFQQMAAQGQSFFNASGDSDAFTGSVAFPADNPYITQVGGTTLTTDDTGAYSSEKVWNWGNGIGSSGGISTYYPTPPWQQGLDVTNNLGSSTLRNIPDVALTADNIYVVADNGTSENVGGTSAAAPLWAAFTALVNEQATAGCGQSVGFLNPAIYGIGKASSYTSLMNDIINGDNFSPSSPGKFGATPGYDLCTGWGSPKANLITALAGSGKGPLSITFAPISGSALLGDTDQPIFITVAGVTNATVTASIPGLTNLVFANDGQPPDVTSNDFVYSASLHVPASLSGFTMTVIATAPDRPASTNVFTYTVVPAPGNDNFVNAIKIPVGGAVYVSNNRFATVETGEPAHDGDANMAASLWWAWTPTTSTSVLIDTVGSRVDNVLAVYTGSALSELKQVAATRSDVAQLRIGKLTFNAQAGQTYRIALAGASADSLGSVRLALTPNGLPDTTIPSVAVIGPQSGLTVSNQTAILTGTAVDKVPNASGINKVVVTLNGCATITASGTTTWTAPVILQSGLNVIQATAFDEAGNASTPVTVDLIYFPVQVANDFFAQPIPLTGASGTNSVDTTTATKETGEPNHAGNQGGKSVWWSFTAPADGVLSLSTEGSSFDTVLAVYTGSSVSSLTPIASDDDAYPGVPGGFSLLDQAVHANQTYAIAVDGYNGAYGTNILSYSFVPATLVHLITTVAGSGSVQLAVLNSLGGKSVQPAATVDVARNSTLILTPTPAPNNQFDSWSGDVFSISDPLTLVIRSNLSVTAHFVPVSLSDGFESGDLLHLSWATTGSTNSKPWLVESTNVAAGRFAARSGVIGNNQSSSLLLTTNFIATDGSFDYRVSSELGFDFLKFFVDGSEVHEWSGEAGWTTFTFSLPAGTHTLEWRYIKDPSGTAGLDAAFIDNVILPIALPKDNTTPAHLQWVRSTDGALFINLLGQTNQQYILQTSADLINWQNLSSGVADNGFLRIDPGALTNRTQFYRAVVP